MGKEGALIKEIEKNVVVGVKVKSREKGRLHPSLYKVNDRIIEF